MQLPLAANALATLGNGAATIGGQQQQMQQPQQMPQENPGILQAQLMQQEQQRKMAQALMGQGYIPNSGGLGALAMVASAWKGKKMQKEADEKIADATKRLFEAQNAEEQRKAAAALQAEIDKENRKFQQDAAMKGIEHGYKEAETPQDIKELRMLREDPALAQHDLTRRRAGASSTNITMPGENYAKPFDEALAKQDAQFYTDLRAQSQGAASVINNMNRLETTLKNVPGGKANDVIGQIGQIFGTERGATRDAVEAQVQAAVDKILQLQPGPKTDQDAARARAQIPNMATSAQARKVVFDFIRSGATESQRQFKEADRYAREKGNLYGFTPSPQSPVTQDAVPQRAVNPQTGETVEFRNGTWVKVK